MQIYDLIIIGAGPAGITASVYAARKNLEFLVIASDIGGQTALSGDIENYTGYQFITGPELTQKFQEHMRKYGIPLRENEEALEIAKSGEIISVHTNKADYQSRALIIASGKRSKELQVPGEKEFKNHGLTYCAICDGPLFKGKVVAVIGGGNSAMDAVLQLIKIAKHIYVINIGDKLTGDAIMSQKIAEAENVTVMNNHQVSAVVGDKFVRAIKIKNKDGQKELAVEGVFIEIGLVPNSSFAKGLDKNSGNEIIIDQFNKTNVPGIFAAGDVTNIPEKQIIIAAGEGSKAALGAFRYLDQKKF